MIAALAVLALQQPSPPPADTTQGRPCLIVIDSIGHEYREITLPGGRKNSFAGGGVLAHCQGTTSTLATDSLARYADANRIDLVGHVRIRDTVIALDASNASYFMSDERLEAHRNVVAVNKANGSILRGPNLTYYRVVRGIRDTLEMYATQRPTIEYRGAGAADTVEPYIIVGDRVRFKGNDRMWAAGKATIDRSDFAARGDSMHLDETSGMGFLVGKPRVEGKGPQSYTLTGTRIELALAARDLKQVRALGEGVVTGTDWHMNADTIHLLIDQRKLQQVFAWGKTTRPHAVSTLQDIKADSIALDVPNQVLTEARAYGNAFSSTKKDSTSGPANTDWITGDTLTARWAQEPDSAGVARSRLRQVIARGSARALTHLYNDKDSTTAALGPSINYSRGKVIDIALKQSGIDRVIASGGADGVHLEPRPPAPPDTTAKKDST